MNIYKSLIDIDFWFRSADPPKVAMNIVLFYACAAIAVIAALNVILQRRTMHAAISLVVALAALSGIYFLLGAQFIGMIQLIIYAGAVMVMFLIVIMLLDPYSEVFLRSESRLWVLMAVALGGGLFTILAVAIGRFRPPPAASGQPALPAGPNTESLAAVLFQKYMLPIQPISILILDAIIGAVVLAKKRASDGR